MEFFKQKSDTLFRCSFVLSVLIHAGLASIVLTEGGTLLKPVEQPLSCSQEVEFLPESFRGSGNLVEKIEGGRVESNPEADGNGIIDKSTQGQRDGLGAKLEAGYTAVVKSKIAAQKRYPEWARRKRHEGEVLVAFGIIRSGFVYGLRVEKSSGFLDLDRAAVEAVRDSEPFEAIPDCVDDDRIEMKIVLKFLLTDHRIK